MMESLTRRLFMTLDKYTLHKDQKSDRWRLEKEGSNRAKRTFDTKEDALKNLRGAVGPHGGSVRIRKVDNTIQAERTYPRSKDPKSSKDPKDPKTRSKDPKRSPG